MLIRSLVAVLACFALAAPALASPPPTPVASAPVRVSGPSPFASCAVTDPSDANGKPHVNFVVEPRVAIDPRTIGTPHVHLVGVWQQDRWTAGGGATGIVSAVSGDGGTHWTERPLPITSCASSDSKNTRASDPWVSIGPDGTVYASALTFQGPDLTVGVSHDGGQTWQNWQTIKNDSGLPLTADKDSITADPTTPGVAYLVWDSNDPPVNGVLPTSVYFSMTRDGGQTWSPARQITPASAGDSLSPELLIDPSSHALHVVVRFDRFILPYGHICLGMPRSCTFRRIIPAADFASIDVLSSQDDGATWSSPHTIAPVCPATGSPLPALIRDPVVPDAAIDTAGRLFVVWEDGCFSSHTARDIALSTSTDGGTTWSAPSRVNPPGGWHLLPTIATAADGTLGVLWAQITPDSSTNSLPADYQLALSTDHGETFSQPVRLDGPFNLADAPDPQQHFVGDYQGLAAGTAFYPFFVAPSQDASDPTNVYAAPVSTSASSSPAVPEDATRSAAQLGPFVPSSEASGQIPLVRASGSDPFSSCEPHRTADGVTNRGSTVEPHLAVGPGRSPTLIAVWQQDRWSDGGAQGIMAASSSDGGQTWSDAPLPFTNCALGGMAYSRASDPWAAVGPDGKVYASAIVASADHSGALADFHVAVSTSHDGRAWSSSVVLPSGPDQIDGDEVVADSRQPGAAYVVWDQRAADGEDTVISRTADGGHSWSAPSRIAHEAPTGAGAAGVQLMEDSVHHQLVELVQTLGGPSSRFRECAPGRLSRSCARLVAPGSSSALSSLAVLTSRDGGISWSQPHVIAQRMRWSSKGYPSIRAADPTVEGIDPTTGRIYVAWQDGRFSHGKGGDIAIAWSDDGGVTWTAPARAVAAGPNFLFAPAIAVTSGGAVGLSYYRVSRGRHDRYPATRWISVSTDQGNRFAPALRLGRSFRYTMAAGTGSMPHPRSSGYFLGDYEGMAAGDSFYALFSRPDGSHVKGHTEIVCGSLAPPG